MQEEILHEIGKTAVVFIAKNLAIRKKDHYDRERIIMIEGIT